MKLKWKQTVSALAMTSALSLSFSSVFAASTAAPEKIPAWASGEIAAWQSMGLLEGDQNGLIHPNDGIKKAEFAALINRIFRFSEESGQIFGDVPLSSWYAADMYKAAAAGIIVGSGNGNGDPLEILTREKAALMLSRVFHAEAGTDAPSSFRDDADIADWSKAAVYAMKEEGYVDGTPQGDFLPQKALTRAEAVKMINNAMGELIADSEDHEGLSSGNLVVNTPGGQLSDLDLSGNLYITSGVGEGNLGLTNAEVGGTVYVNGGGTHSITFVDSDLFKVVIDKKNGAVRVVASGSTTTGTLNVQSAGIVENQSSTPIGHVNVMTDNGETVQWTGDADQVTVSGKTELIVGPGSIDALMVTAEASGTHVTLNEGAKINQLTFDSPGSVTGEGEIDTVVVNVEGVEFSKMPTHLTLNAGSVTIAGKVMTQADIEAVSGGSGTGGSVVVPTQPKTTKLYSYEEALSSFSSTGAEGYVKQYLTFLQDPTYTPATANPDVDMPDLTNANTFVNYQFDVQPSIFPSMRGVNTSVLDESRTYLWIGTDEGVTKIKLSTNAMKDYKAEDNQLSDDKVLLLIPDGQTGVFAITETGVSHIYQ
ncbi:S-layer homology domain-containing protein [Paenibacillus sp. HB172176]|uniref:S-layer homology domain-containing protein n=1 Tax=Paenibacillus sp. HB172176 TaxID=2493690 RepID=UPI00143A105B|nr:S-layer homology domain-containing protein [Paenibacillus sp. HB172176]